MSKKKTYEEFIAEFNDKFPDRKYYFDKSTFINSHTPMRFICHKKDKNGVEHGEFWRTPKSLLSYECVKCSYEERAVNNLLTNDEFILKALYRHGNKYDYSKVEYVGTKEPITIICPIHGEFKQSPNCHLSGEGCPYCNSSHLEEQLKIGLDRNNIKYIFQFHNKWLGHQSLDFYLPDFNVAIECQGKQHFGLGGWSEFYDFQKQYELDIKKKQLCIDNQIDILYLIDKRIKSYVPLGTIYDNNNTFFNIDNLINYVNKRAGNSKI